MKIVLIIANNKWKAPYCDIYIQYFKQLYIDVEIISWDRDLTDRKNYLTYRGRKINGHIQAKFFDYIKYHHFVIKSLKKLDCDRIVIFGIQSAIFLFPLLRRSFYKNKFILDIRDYSPILNYKLSKKILLRIIQCSFICAISSPGFIQWLPKIDKYIVSHNIQKDKHNLMPIKVLSGALKILTIGSLRDLESNVRLISALGNDSHFNLQFAGDGYATPFIKEYIERHNITNAKVTGKYDKKEEEFIVSKSDMINIILPNNILSNYLMSNRFYLSVIHGKPMIVNNGCTQALFTKKYNLGVIINDNDNIAEKIDEYWNNFNINDYNAGRRAFIQMIEHDQSKFYQALEQFIKI